MKFTQYFLHNRDRPDRRQIDAEWIERVIRDPLREHVQADGRIRLWGRIDEAEGRYLRVVLLEDRQTIHNAFFDRRFKEEDDDES
jgi:KaiC/GvpD/RAD55 family RecA-like ATPase